MEELAEELATFCARRSTWIRFLQGRIRAGSSAGRGVANEERLLRRVVAKGNALAEAVKKEKKKAKWALGEVQELESELEVAMQKVDEAHQRLEMAERIQAVLTACPGRQHGLVRTAAGWVD
eukprot:SAG11_NODE_2054_length_3878_cov_1.867161_6_plen_122_part_00